MMTSAQSGSFASGAASIGTAFTQPVSANEAKSVNPTSASFFRDASEVSTPSGYRVTVGDSFDTGALTVGDLGERATLSVILAVLTDAGSSEHPHVLVGPGDDAALLRLNGALAVSTDAMVEGVDFRLDWTSGFQLGWKLAATNLSDIAAMGATALGLTVTVCAPQQTPIALLTDVTRGIAAASRELAPGCSLVGGDLSQGTQLSFAVTALGELEGPAVLRSGAREGNVVAYAGVLGLSGAGLRLLQRHCGEGCSPQRRADLWRDHPQELTAHLQPCPPVSLGVAAAAAGATAMMDVSDGLALDASRIGEASDVTLNLSSELLAPFSEQTSTEDVLFGGEDHGLLATFPAGGELPDGFVLIGDVRARSDALLLDGEPLQPRGWDPFAEHPTS